MNSIKINSIKYIFINAILKTKIRVNERKDNKNSSLSYAKREKIIRDNINKIIKRAKKKIIAAREITKKKTIAALRRSRRFNKNII